MSRPSVFRPIGSPKATGTPRRMSPTPKRRIDGIGGPGRVRQLLSIRCRTYPSCALRPLASVFQASYGVRQCQAADVSSILGPCRQANACLIRHRPCVWARPWAAGTGQPKPHGARRAGYCKLQSSCSISVLYSPSWDCRTPRQPLVGQSQRQAAGSHLEAFLMYDIYW